MKRLDASKFIISLSMYVVLFTLLLAAAASAQTVLTVGVDGGRNLTSYESTITDIEPTDLRNVVAEGNGAGNHYGAFADIGITERFGIRARLGVESRSYENSFDGVVEVISRGSSSSGKNGGGRQRRGLTTAEPEPVAMRSDYRVDASYTNAGFQLRYNPAAGLQLLAGASVSYLSGNAEMRTTLTVLDEDWQFTDGTTTRQSIDDISGSMTRINYGIDFGIGYDVEITDNVIITPMASINYVIGNVEEDQRDDDGPSFSNARVTNIRLGTSVGLMF